MSMRILAEAAVEDFWRANPELEPLREAVTKGVACVRR